MNTQQRIDSIAEELRVIYNTTNEGPRLIAEMVEREFPESAARLGGPEKIAELEEDITTYKARISDLRDEVSDLEDENAKYLATIAELEAGD